MERAHRNRPLRLDCRRRGGREVSSAEARKLKAEAANCARYRKRAETFGRPRFKNAFPGDDERVEARGALSSFAKKPFAASSIRCPASWSAVAPSVRSQGRTDQRASRNAERARKGARTRSRHRRVA
jgi:hypothetical protein